MTKAALATMGLALVAAGAASAFVAWQVALQKRYDEAFDNTKNGDSFEMVIARFGQPSVVAPCPKADQGLSPSKDVSPLYTKCAKLVWFKYVLSYMDLGAWVIELDSNDRVVEKYFVTSP